MSVMPVAITMSITPMLDDIDTAWGELFGIAACSAAITIAVIGIATLIWMGLTVIV